MITLKDITDLNLQELISQLTSEVINGNTTSSSAKFACEINSCIIDYNISDIEIINTQLKNTKIFYRKGLISKLDYKKYKKYCLISRFKSNIDQFTLYFSTNYKDPQNLKIVIEELQHSCSSKLILELPHDYIRKIDSLMSIIDNAIQRSSDFNKTISEKLNKLKSTLSQYIAYNDVVQKQEITINIKPIDKNFELEDLSFVSTNNKQYFKHNSITLKNLHIEELEVCENIYGINGYLTFDLAYINNHKDFDFLLNPNQPILIDIQIKDSFNFYKKESKKDHHKRSTRFLVIGFNSNNLNIHESFEYSIYSYSKNVSSGVKKFKIQFYDPLKALWTKHQPSYIALNKSLDDIFKENFFFDNLVSLDTNKSNNLKIRIPQTFISTINRSFYDFFIEQLQHNKCYLKYFCDKKSAKVSYYIIDQVDNALQKNIANSDEDLKNKLSPYDIGCFKKQILISNKSNFYVKEKNICPDVTLNAQRKDDRKISDTLIKPFSSIFKDNLQAVQYIQSNNDDKQKIITTGFEILLTSRNTLPFLDTEITLSKLENDQNYLLGATDIKTLYISQRKLLFKRSKYCSKQLYENLHNFHYKSDSESDVYEKIAFIKCPNLTHDNLITYTIKDYSNLTPEYPKYKIFNKFYINGRITIGENVNNDSKKAYKFFKNYKPEESSIAEFQENGEKGTSAILNSKADILYAIEIAKEMLSDKSSDKPIIYLPLKVNINSANNQFIPLRNDDIILIEIQSFIKGEIIELISNSAISTKKAQQQLLQRQLLGSKQNCEIAYTQTSDGETFSLTQLNENNQNFFLINDKKGIFLRYKSKGN